MHYTSTLSLFYEVEHEISQSKKVIRVTSYKSYNFIHSVSIQRLFSKHQQILSCITISS